MSVIPEDIDHRTYSRVNLFRPLQLIHESGSVIKANLRDISPGGAQAMCDRDNAHALGSDTRVDPSTGAQVFASFNLSVDDNFLDVEVDCRLIHLSLEEHEAVVIGLRFVSFRGHSLDHLRRFILSSLEPAY